jgi:hypothetical protein
MEAKPMSQENGKKEKGLSDYGSIYLSGAIEDGTSENVCKEIIEYNISGKPSCSNSLAGFQRIRENPIVFPKSESPVTVNEPLTRNFFW